MKAQIKNFVFYFRLVLALLVTLSSITGCSAWFWLMKPSSQTASQQSNPLAGWTFKSFPGWGVDPNGHNSNILDKSITDDYQNFIAKNNLVLFGAITGFYENGTGQHAVQFEAFPPNQNATWHYVLIYDKENKRIKVMKYGYRRFQS